MEAIEREKRSKEGLEDLHGARPSIFIQTGKAKGWECSAGEGWECSPRAWSPWILSFEGGWVGNVARPKYGIFMYTLLNYIRILNRSAGCATHVACYEHIFYEQDDNARAGS